MDGNDTLIAESHIALEERIRRRAHEIWKGHKDKPGGDTSLDDWLQAETEILGNGKQPAQDRGSVVGPA